MDICRSIKNLVKEHLSTILSLRDTGELKKDNTFVSKGDIFCQDLIISFLKENLADCYIISEELDDFNPEELKAHEYVVTIDPIDGTENFVCGLKEWGIGISIYRRSSHYQSMIFLPELNESLISGDIIEKKYRSRICGLSSYMTANDLEAINKGFEYRIMGCCMYNILNVIKGSFSQFTHLKGCYSWDILPGLNLAIENGKYVEIEGRPYNGEFLMPKIRYHFIIK